MRDKKIRKDWHSKEYRDKWTGPCKNMLNRAVRRVSVHENLPSGGHYKRIRIDLWMSCDPYW